MAFTWLPLNVAYAMAHDPFSITGSSQSRADLLTLGLAVTNILNGLVWLSIKPKSISTVRKLLHVFYHALSHIHTDCLLV